MKPTTSAAAAGEGSPWNQRLSTTPVLTLKRASRRAAQALYRALQPLGGKGIALVQLCLEVADQIKLIGIVRQQGLAAGVFFQLVPQGQHVLLQPGSRHAVFQCLAGLALRIAVVHIVEVAGAGLVQVVEQAQIGHPCWVHVAHTGQHIAHNAHPVGVLGHVFLPGAQKGVARAGGVPQHTDFVKKICQTVQPLCAHVRSLKIAVVGLGVVAFGIAHACSIPIPTACGKDARTGQRKMPSIELPPPQLLYRASPSFTSIVTICEVAVLFCTSVISNINMNCPSPMSVSSKVTFLPRVKVSTSTS